MSYPIYAEQPIADIMDERARQDDLKRAGRFAYTCADPELSHAERLTVLGEEFGEVCHEVNEAIGGRTELDRAALRNELVQVAAVCVAWIEAIDAEHVMSPRYPGAAVIECQQCGIQSLGSSWRLRDVDQTWSSGAMPRCTGEREG